MSLRILLLLATLVAPSLSLPSGQAAPFEGELGSQDSVRAFDISSESSLYVVRGRLSGTYQLRPGQLTVTVSSGSVLATQADTSIQLRALVAGAGQGGWKKLAASDPVSLGTWKAGERHQLTEPLTLQVSLPASFDPSRAWLVFQFARSDGNTTYACSDQNLAGPDSFAAARAEQLKRFYPAAC